MADTPENVTPPDSPTMESDIDTKAKDDAQVREPLPESFNDDTYINTSFESAFTEAGDPLRTVRRRRISIRTLNTLRRDLFFAFNDAPVNGPPERHLTAPSPPDTFVDAPQPDEDIPNLRQCMSPLTNLLTEVQKSEGHDFAVVLLPNIIVIWRRGRLAFLPYSKAEPLVFATSRLDTRGAVAYFRYDNRYANNPEFHWEQDNDPGLETFVPITASEFGCHWLQVLKPGEPAIIFGNPEFDPKSGRWVHPAEDSDDQLALHNPALLDDFEDSDDEDSDSGNDFVDSHDSDDLPSSPEAELITPPLIPPFGDETANASLVSGVDAKRSCAVSFGFVPNLLELTVAKMESGLIPEFVPSLRKEQELHQASGQRNSRLSSSSPERTPVDKRVRLQGKNGHQHIHAVGQKTFCMEDEFGKEVYVDFCNIMIATQVYLSKSVLKRLEDHLSKEGGWISLTSVCIPCKEPRKSRESQSHVPFRTFISFAESNHAAQAKQHLSNEQKFEDISFLRVEYHKPNKTLMEKTPMVMKNSQSGRF